MNLSVGWNWALIVAGALLILVEVALGGFAGFDLVLIGSAFLLGGGIGLVLHLLADSGRSLSQLEAGLPPLNMIKRQIDCPSHQIPAVLKRLRAAYAGSPLDLADGVKVTLPDGWFLVRGSNTEPIVRLVAEGQSAAAAETIADAVAGLIGRSG